MEIKLLIMAMYFAGCLIGLGINYNQVISKREQLLCFIVGLVLTFVASTILGNILSK